MAVNIAGYVPIFDNAFPDTFTMRCAANISGGQFVYIGSIAASVSSGGNSFAGPADVLMAGAASGTNVAVGIATHNQASGTSNNVTVLRKGDVIVATGGAFAPGVRVALTTNDAVTELTSGADPIVLVNQLVGTSYTGAGSNSYALLRLDL